jgi:hypothetical protein
VTRNFVSRPFLQSACVCASRRAALEVSLPSPWTLLPPVDGSSQASDSLSSRLSFPETLEASFPATQHIHHAAALLQCRARQASAGHIRPTRSPSGQGQAAAKSRDAPNRGRESRARRPQGRSVFWMSRLPIQWQPQLQPPFRKAGSEGGDEVDPLDRGAQRTGCRHQSETLWYALPLGRVAYSRSLATLRERSCIEGRAAGQSLHWLAFI